ncbi:ion transporter [Sulfurospirillum arcachonense]|uniref:ion transporter n=1 Tax=Sulfurospirillum arcachonense TaxID=57666 RepID=UPI00046AF06A|nr:ion transporter [Sulfurospirillum arcachonense]
MARFYSPSPNENSKWKIKIFDIVFGNDTHAGKWFDIVLILVILLSVLVALFDSIGTIHLSHGRLLLQIEWVFTTLFTIEYIIRLAVVKQPFRFARSFYGVIDLFALLPMYLSLLFIGAQYLAVLRVLRILRIFEILHLRRYTKESSVLINSLLNSWRKIFVFLLAMLAIITVFGAIIFLVEGPEHGFTSIPISMYWALVSVTTVGFGDITPVTPLGQIVASMLILLGYGIIAVPTGIYTAELATSLRRNYDSRVCESCGYKSHESNAKYCMKCGSELSEKS